MVLGIALHAMTQEIRVGVSRELMIEHRVDTKWRCPEVVFVIDQYQTCVLDLTHNRRKRAIGWIRISRQEIVVENEIGHQQLRWGNADVLETYGTAGCFRNCIKEIISNHRLF